jgi:hypothetical protein
MYHGHNNGRRQAWEAHQSAFCADLRAFVGFVLGAGPAASTELVRPVPVDNLNGAAGQCELLIIEPPEEVA